MRGVRLVAITLLATALLATGALADHTEFEYAVDRFELDGNRFGPLDGTPGLVDEFDDGSMDGWYLSYGTAFEADGHLWLTDPGAHFPEPGGSTLDITIIAGQSYVYDGDGDFSATALWAQPMSFASGHHYHLSVFTWEPGVSGFYNETFGVGIQNFPGAFGFEQHRTEIDLAAGVFRNTSTDFFPIDPESITGGIGFRILFDDATNVATTEVSVDGGATWMAPFAGAEIFVGRSYAQFILSADPAVGGGVVTTTTTSTTTSTTTTPPAPACDPAGCWETARRGKARLKMRRRYRKRSDGYKAQYIWKFKKGEPGSGADFGTPTKDTTYELCIGSGGAAPLVHVVLPPAIRCDGKLCWKRTGRKSFAYEDPTGHIGGIRDVTLSPGRDDAARLTVRAKGDGSIMPPLPLDGPLTVRLSNGEGQCWASTFSNVRTSDTTLSARSD